MTRLGRLSRSVAGKVAIVTGAASGMGRATAFLLADEGAKVAVADVADPEAVVDEIRTAGGEATGWVLDVADPASIEQVVAGVVATDGGVDIPVDNAGISRRSPLPDPGWEETGSETMAVNALAIGSPALRGGRTSRPCGGRGRPSPTGSPPRRSS